MNKALFVAVHPDDETLGCGGSILKHRDVGKNFGYTMFCKYRY